MFECTGCHQSFDAMDLHFGACMHAMCRPCLSHLRHQCLSCQRPFGEQPAVMALQARVASMRLYRRMYTALQQQDPALACDLFNAATGDQSPVRTSARAGGAGVPPGMDSLETRLRALEAIIAPIPFDPQALNAFDEDEETRSLEEVPLPHSPPMRGASGPSRARAPPSPPSPPPPSPPRLVRQNAYVGGTSSALRRRRDRDARAGEGGERAQRRRRLLVLSSPSSSGNE
jgi:hypothetical protein